MSVLSALRDSLAATLAPTGPGAYSVYPFIPDYIEPPCIVLQPADDYLSHSEDAGFNEYDLTLDVYCFVPLQSNEQAADDLDQMLAHVATHLPDGWGIDKVGRPGPYAIGEWVGHALPVTVSTYITL